MFRAALLCLVALLAAVPGFSVTIIDFDTLVAGDIVNNQYADVGVIFTGNPQVFDSSFGGAVNPVSPPNYLHITGGSLEFVDPTNSSIPMVTDSVTLVHNGLNSSGGYYGGLAVTALGLDGTVLDTQSIPAIGPNQSRPNTLMTFSVPGIHSLQFVYITNPNGGALAPVDSISFNDLTPGSEIPEPGTLVLLGAGLLATGILRRRSA